MVALRPYCNHPGRAPVRGRSPKPEAFSPTSGLARLTRPETIWEECRGSRGPARHSGPPIDEKTARRAMVEIVNLNKARKAKSRADQASQARANRVKYGRTKAEKENDRRAEERQRALQEGRKLEDEES
ncbi:MAG TPA: DUF4169 family protein [Candidatus Cybelea sp.]|nr:DUF4169 family protein [Candidatus Cybelea sp.]